MNKLISVAALCLCLGAFPPSSASSQTLLDAVRERLRTRVETAGTPPRIVVGGEPIHAIFTLPLFYERRTYQPAWIGNRGKLELANELVNAIREADQDGLSPEDYHLSLIELTLQNIGTSRGTEKSLDPAMLTDLDLLLTDAFLIYGSHLLAGRINPETIDPEWVANRREVDLAMSLQAALDSTQIEAKLKSFLPPHPGYQRLRLALARYRDMAKKGGWPLVPDGPKMEKGDRDKRVIVLRTRLGLSSDLGYTSEGNGDLFDEELEEAVLKFQENHGLKADGIVGRLTMTALNVPVEDRVRQIEYNLERWRWLPQDLGKRYILVNIANFELDVLEDSQAVMNMRVVVGKNYRRTPVFSDRMTYLVLNPYWHVPPEIAVKDILPLVRKDVNYLVEKHIKLFEGWGVEARAVDQNMIDWRKITPANFRYRFRQEPGSANALGRVKFMFPNRFDVYLHDTPSRELFEKTERTFSSGCIRLEKAMKLAEYVLRGNPQWTSEKLLAAIDRSVELTVRLPEPIMIHILYWTAWANENGSVHFLKDIYGRDQRLRQALQEPPPSSH